MGLPAHWRKRVAKSFPPNCKNSKKKKKKKMIKNNHFSILEIDQKAFIQET